jgi:hypothetical protein
MPSTPMPLRWTEQAEAAQLCALAELECQLRGVAAGGIPWSGSRPSLAARLVAWFAQPQPEIKMGVKWPDGLS